jgi:hypothetical protein
VGGDDELAAALVAMVVIRRMATATHRRMALVPFRVARTADALEATRTIDALMPQRKGTEDVSRVFFAGQVEQGVRRGAIDATPRAA